MQWERDYMSYRKKIDNSKNRRSERRRTIRANSLQEAGSAHLMDNPRGGMKGMCIPCGCLKRNKGEHAEQESGGLASMPSSPGRMASFFANGQSIEMQAPSEQSAAKLQGLQALESKEDLLGIDGLEHYEVNEQGNIRIKNKKKLKAVQHLLHACRQGMC